MNTTHPMSAIGSDAHDGHGNPLVTRRAVLAASAGAALLSAAPRSFAAAFQSGRWPADADFASAREAGRLIRERHVSSLELTRRMLDRIHRFNPGLNAVVNVLEEQALAEARHADSMRSREERRLPLHGVPIVIKDQFEITGVPTTAGLKELANYRPKQDSEVVRRLRAAGAIILGNTNVPLFLHDWQSYNAIYGTTNNPWDPTRTPGGSSGGSAAALAAGLAYFSPGSDMSGSLRVPAHFCGVCAHKPSHDVVSLRGWFPAPSGGVQTRQALAVAGPMARTVGDLRLGMEILGGPDGAEALAYRWAMPAPRKRLLKDFTVGFVMDDAACALDGSMRRPLDSLLETLRRSGVNLREGWPKGIDPREQFHTYQYIMMANTPLPPGLSRDALRPLAAKGDGSLGSIFAQAQTDTPDKYAEQIARQAAARAAWQAAFADIDVFVMPASFVAAFPHDHSEPQDARKLATQAGPRHYLDQMFWSAFANLAGLPSTAVPVGRTDSGLPVGVQVMGPFLEDATPLAFAEGIEEVLGGFAPPPGFI